MCRRDVQKGQGKFASVTVRIRVKNQTKDIHDEVVGYAPLDRANKDLGLLCGTLFWSDWNQRRGTQTCGVIYAT